MPAGFSFSELAGRFCLQDFPSRRTAGRFCLQDFPSASLRGGFACRIFLPAERRGGFDCSQRLQRSSRTVLIAVKGFSGARGRKPRARFASRRSSGQKPRLVLLLADRRDGNRGSFCFSPTVGAVLIAGFSFSGARGRFRLQDFRPRRSEK